MEISFEVQEFDLYAGRTIDDGEIMIEVYTVIYHTGILTEDFEKWDESPNMEKTWAKFQMHFTDARWNMHKSQNQTDKQTGFHGENTVLTDKLESENNTLTNMEHTAMTNKYKSQRSRERCQNSPSGLEQWRRSWKWY